MLGVFAVLASASALAAPPTLTLDPQALPELPVRGLVRETVAGIELQTMQGRPLGVIPRFDLAPAQWSAECEIPLAFLVVDGVMRPYGGRTMEDAPESAALGWLPNGSAVIHYPKGACGGSHRAPGVYAVPRRGTSTLLVRTPKFEHYWMWGG
jgi:hypothetical protein